MIARGEFPQAISFPGEHRSRWRWVDVTWYLLGREIAARLAPEAPGEGEGGEPSPGPKRGSPGVK